MAFRNIVKYSHMNQKLKIAQTKVLNIEDYFTKRTNEVKKFESFLISPDGNYFAIIIVEGLSAFKSYCVIVHCTETGNIIYRGKWEFYPQDDIIYKFSQNSEFFLCCGNDDIMILKLQNLSEKPIQVLIQEFDDILYFDDQYIFFRQGEEQIRKYSIQKRRNELIFKHEDLINSNYLDQNRLILFNKEKNKFVIYHLKTSKQLKRSSVKLNHFQNPTAFQNPRALQNPRAFYPITFQHPRAFEIPLAFQNLRANQNPITFQNPRIFKNPIIFKNQYLILQSQNSLKILLVMNNKILRRNKIVQQEGTVQDIEINQSLLKLNLTENKTAVWQQFDLLQGIFQQFSSSKFVGYIADQDKIRLTKRLFIKLRYQNEIEYTVFKQ